MTSPLNKEEILSKVCKQVDTWLTFRKPYFDQIRKYEDMYLGKTLPALKGRFNIPLPIMEGFVDSLLSKIDDQISIGFSKNREATYKVAKKLSSAWSRDAAPDRGNFNGADLDAKHLAIFSGLGLYELKPNRKPYSQELSAIDYWDIVAEPFGGSDIDKHLFKGRMNVFIDKEYLINGANNELYFKDEVNRLVNGLSEDTKKINSGEQEEKLNRYSALGLSPSMNNYVGSGTYNLTKMVSRFDGKDYYVLFDYANKVLLRYEPLSELFSSELSPFVSWQTSRSPVSFLPRPVIAQIYPVAEAMRILVNQNFDNIQKRNWQQIAYNAKNIINPQQLEFRPNGLVEVKLEPGQRVTDVWGNIETPDVSSITINLVNWLDGFLGQKTGITPGAQGVGEEDKVAIYEGNIQQVADRFGLINKFYKQAHVDIAKRWKSNFIDNAPSKGYMVKYIGKFGNYEEELTTAEAKEELDIIINSVKQEQILSETKNKNRKESLWLVLKDEQLKSQASPEWLFREVLSSGGYEEEEIKTAMSKDEGGDAELMSEAMLSCEMIVDGKEPKKNRGANTAFIRKILFYLQDNSDWLDDKQYTQIYKYAIGHLEIAKQNADMLLLSKGTEQINDNTGQNQTPQGQIPAGGRPENNIGLEQTAGRPNHQI